MGVGAGLYMYVVVVQKFTFAISSPDEFLYLILEEKSCGNRLTQIYLEEEIVKWCVRVRKTELALKQFCFGILAFRV